MKRREFIALISLSAAWSAAAQAQQRPVLGLLSSSEIPDWAIKPFRAGLEEGGYVEGSNLTAIYRSAENQLDRLPALAAELVRRRVAVIAAAGTPACDGAEVRDGLVHHEPSRKFQPQLILHRRAGQ